MIAGNIHTLQTVDSDPYSLHIPKCIGSSKRSMLTQYRKWWKDKSLGSSQFEPRLCYKLVMLLFFSQWFSTRHYFSPPHFQQTYFLSQILGEVRMGWVRECFYISWVKPRDPTMYGTIKCQVLWRLRNPAPE
jgi:hypothetical protein